jgi:hypothetical protein
MTTQDGSPKRMGFLSPDLLNQLAPFFGPGPSQTMVIRARDRRTGSAILAEIARGRSGPGVVVNVPEGPPAAPELDATLGSLPPSWWLLRTSDDLAPIAATAAAIRLIGTLVREAGNEPVVPALWLPPSILEGYSLLPKAPEVSLAVDSWDALLEAYLRGRRGEGGDVPTEEELERILLRSSEDYLTVHLIVVTRRPHPVLEGGSEFVLEVPDSTGDPSRPAAVRLVRAAPRKSDPRP